MRISDRVVLVRTSALAAGLQYAADSRCDVITLSMGGLPSRLWGEVIDELYERGVCICAAAGNHVGSSPTRVLVYPARYPRVIAVCGVMADGRPYADLDGVLEGSFGTTSVMGQAIAAYTPNIPWPQYGCRGESDSMARAPRQRHHRLPRLLRCGSSATSSGFRGTGGASRRYGMHSFPAPGRAMPKHFGNGILQAHSALGVAPDLNRSRSPTSEASFPLFRLITGLGLAEGRRASRCPTWSWSNVS